MAGISHVRRGYIARKKILNKLLGGIRVLRTYVSVLCSVASGFSQTTPAEFPFTAVPRSVLRITRSDLNFDPFPPPASITFEEFTEISTLPPPPRSSLFVPVEYLLSPPRAVRREGIVSDRVAR